MVYVKSIENLSGELFYVLGFKWMSKKRFFELTRALRTFNAEFVEDYKLWIIPEDGWYEFIELNPKIVSKTPKRFVNEKAGVLKKALQEKRRWDRDNFDDWEF